MNAITENKPKAELTVGGRVSGLVPQTIEEAFRISQAVVKAGMTPYGMDTPEKCLIAVMSGAEVGLPPMQSVQNIAVINNRPCMWGDALIGVVRASGFCLYVKEWFEGDGDDLIAFCETQRKGEENSVTETFSVKDAIKAGLWQTEAVVTRRGKGGSTYEKENDSPWYKHPKRMLKMRARAFCLRDVYADVLKGLQVREEIEDYQDYRGPTNAKDVTPSINADKYLTPKEESTFGQDNIASTMDGFSSDHVDSEIETLNSDDETPEQPSSDVGEGTDSPSTKPSPDLNLDALFEVRNQLFDIFDSDDYQASDNPDEWAKKRSGVVMGKLQSGVLASANPQTHKAANGVLDVFKSICNGDQTVEGANAWFDEVWGA